MKSMVWRNVGILFVFLFWMILPARAEYIQAPAAIQIASTVSDGKYSLADIAAIAKKNGIKVLVITDRDHMRWEYGLWPLRNIVRKRVESHSISTYGIKRYLSELEDLRRRNSDIVILNGLESAPFYYWQGSVFEDNLAICGWHKHMVTIGLTDPNDYRYLPVVENPRGLAKPHSFKDLLFLWPVLLVFAGFGLLRKRLYRYTDALGRELGPYAKSWQIAGICLAAVGLAFLGNNLSFRSYDFDQYHGDRGAMPFQHFIDYVKMHGGLTFWAHPEVENCSKQGQIEIITPEHSDLLFQTQGYTGFAVFNEGYKRIGVPGGIWDTLLEQYCLAKRKNPVWAIAALAFDSDGTLDEYLKDLKTVLLLRSLNTQEAFNALQQGRSYCLRGRNASQFVLRAVTIRDSEDTVYATMGEHVRTQGIPEIRIQGDISDGQNKVFTIKLIRDTRIIKTFETPAPFDIAYLDEEDVQQKSSYYRLEIQGPDVTVITNPIFVERINKP